MHALIKVMTPSEKRAFKIFANRHVIGQKNNYVKLFDSLDKQKEYDEDALIKSLGGLKYAKYLSADKYYLYGLTLNSLDSFHSNSSIDNKLHRQLHFIEVLFEKGLYGQAGKLMEKCKKLAETHDKYEELLRIKHWEREIVMRQGTPEGLVVFLENHYQEVHQILKVLTNRYMYHTTADRIFALHKTKGMARSPQDLEAYHKLYNKELLDNEAGALCYDAKRLLYASRMFYFHATGEVNKSHEARRKLVQLIEGNPERMKAHIRSYIYALNNLLISCILTRNELEFHEVLSKLTSIPDHIPSTSLTQDMRVRIFESRYIHETDFLIKFARFKEGAQLCDQIEQELENIIDQVDHAFLLTLYNNMMVLYFGAGEYKKALKWLNLILNERTGDTREDIMCYARIINLIIHYELNNHLILPYLLRSTYRYLSQKKPPLKYERLVMDTMRKILRTRNPEALPGLLSSLRDKLLPLADDPFERIMTEDLNLIAWLESKVSDTTYAEIAANQT